MSHDDLPYRPGVGAMVINAEGRVFVGRRIDNKELDAWQMPQGGVDKGEDPETALYRELEEAGVLEGRGRSGTFVAAADASGAVLASAAAEFAAQAAGSGFGADEAIDAVRTAFSHLD